MANTNLFYSLYSTSNDTISAGYTCSSAVDESDTSFDISDDKAVITDSNGNTLASLDLSAIHEANITLYNVETRILQPYSCYLLQGYEYGYAYTSYYYPVIGSIAQVDGYERYCNMSFDIFYDDIMNEGYHIETTADGYNSFVDQINEDFSNNNINVTTSIQVLTDPITNKTSEYLVFLSQVEGFFYFIRNLRIDPVMASEDYPDSPFSNSLDDIKTQIYDLILQIHPLLPGEVYDEETYDVNCNLYKWFIKSYVAGLEDLSKFQKALEYLAAIDEESSEEEIDDILSHSNWLIKGTVYDDDVIGMYDDNNMQLILQIMMAIDAIVKANQAPSHVWMREDVHRRIPVMKYPNGAFRGIVLLPDWPTNTDDYDYASLWISHIHDTATLLEPVPMPEIPEEILNNTTHYKMHPQEPLYFKRDVGVLANATLINELQNCQWPGHNVMTNGNFVTTIEEGYEDAECENYEFNDNYSGPYEEDHPLYETIFMGRSYYSRRDRVIGLYRYLQYITENDMWNKLGDAYIIVGKADDPQVKTKNLPNSLLIYNPNPVPIRIKYMIFS